MNARDTVATLIPTLRYHNAPAAIDWLCRVFGFERHLVVPGEDGNIVHAQIVFGRAMVMLSTARDDAFGGFMTPPPDLGGAGTQGIYVVVADADTHYQHAIAAGAQVVYDIKDEDYGGRGYSCLDPEGHLWSFGTYDPWA